MEEMAKNNSDLQGHMEEMGKTNIALQRRMTQFETDLEKKSEVKMPSLKRSWVKSSCNTMIWNNIYT